MTKHETLGETLERARLTHREHRVEQVLAQLGERRRARSGPVPTGLDQAIDGFSRELRQVRAQLALARALEARNLHTMVEIGVDESSTAGAPA